MHSWTQSWNMSGGSSGHRARQPLMRKLVISISGWDLGLLYIWMCLCLRHEKVHKYMLWTLANLVYGKKSVWNPNRLHSNAMYMLVMILREKAGAAGELILPQVSSWTAVIRLAGGGRVWRLRGPGGWRGPGGGGRGPVVWDVSHISQLNILSQSLTAIQELEVGEGDALWVNLTISPATRHSVQPAHVNTSTSPQRAGPNHPRVGLGHPVPVVPVTADLKLKIVSCGRVLSVWPPPPSLVWLTVLLHVDGGRVPVLVVDQLVPVVGVDLAPALRAHHPGVQVVDVGLTAAPVTTVPVAVTC